MRNSVEQFFNRIKQCRRIATRYDKVAATPWPSSSSHQSGCGFVSMNPHPSHGLPKRLHPTDFGQLPTILAILRLIV
jgi:hypothetical protein